MVRFLCYNQSVVSMYWLISVFALWFLVAWIIPFFALPFMRKQSLPNRFPRDLEQAAYQLVKRHEVPIEYICGSCEYLLSQNYSRSFVGLFYVGEAFENDVRSLLERRGFMHSHQLCYLMRVLLSKSSFASDADIRMRYTFLNFHIHPYLEVRVVGQWYAVDVAGYSRGVSLGRYGRGFRK